MRKLYELSEFFRLIDVSHDGVIKQFREVKAEAINIHDRSHLKLELIVVTIGEPVKSGDVWKACKRFREDC